MEKTLRTSSVKLPRFLKWARLLRAYLKNKKKKGQPQEEEVDEDFISRLPNDILHIILSKLPIRDAAITSAVSKRWAPLFSTLPSLKIDAASFNPVNPEIDSDNVKDINEWVDALFAVLDSRRAPVQKFEIGVEILDCCELDFFEVFDDLCAAGVQELVIRNYEYCDLYEIPWPVFSCNTIVKLEIQHCVLAVPSKVTGLRAVKSLDLFDVTVADDHLRRMISRCKAMEKLVIIDCNKVKNIVIRAPSLLELVISSSRPLAISLISSPRLTSVKVSFMYYLKDRNSDGGFCLNDSEKTFEGTNLINFLNGLCGVKYLQLNFSNVYRMMLSKEGVALPTRLSPQCYLLELKKLCLSWPYNYQTFNMILSCLLNSSPHLTEIIICVDSSHDYKNLELDFWEKQLPAECVKHQLIIAIFYLESYKLQDYFGFQKFLLLNAEILKNMNIFYKFQEESETTKKIKNELLTVQMASPDVEITIKPIISRYQQTDREKLGVQMAAAGMG